MRDLLKALNSVATVAIHPFNPLPRRCLWPRSNGQERRRRQNRKQLIVLAAVKLIRVELASVDAAVFPSVRLRLIGNPHDRSRCFANTAVPAIRRPQDFAAAAENHLTLERWNGFQ